MNEKLTRCSLMETNHLDCNPDKCTKKNQNNFIVYKQIFDIKPTSNDGI